ncbi:MAG: aminoacyl-tRNA deacylase [Candidatus Hodarchaeales archaeon]|jgi:prolyl-tRNA editing enzyme YbaK/EbsC (Cys-tRNA(Pro) deacylase)
MDQYAIKLKQFLEKECVPAEHILFDKSCHSVAAAAEAANSDPDDFIKSICLKLESHQSQEESFGGLVVAIVKGADRASTKRVAKVMKAISARLATPEEILEETGYPVGGTPPLGFDAEFLIDPRVIEKEAVFGGGGSTKALIYLSTQALKQANNGRIVRIRK